MVCRCCVPGCESTGDYDKFSFFTFPTNKERRLEWCRALGRRLESINSSSRVCLLHFKPTDISQTKSDRPEQYRHSRLLKDAVPSINQVFFEMPQSQPEPPKKKARKKKKSNISDVLPDDDLSPIDKLIPNSSGMEFLSQIGKLFPDSDEDTDNKTNCSLPISSASYLTINKSVTSSACHTAAPVNSISNGEQTNLSGAVAYLRSEMFCLPQKPAIKVSSPRKSKRKRSIPNYQEVESVNDEVIEITSKSDQESSNKTSQNLKIIRTNCRNALMQLADTIDQINSEEFLGLIANNIDSIAMLCKSHVRKETESKAPVSQLANKSNLTTKPKGRPPLKKPNKRKYTKRTPSKKVPLNIPRPPLHGPVRLSSIKLIPIPPPPAMQPSTEINENFILKPQLVKEEQNCHKLCANSFESSGQYVADTDEFTKHNINNYNSFSSAPVSNGAQDHSLQKQINVKDEFIDCN